MQSIALPEPRRARVVGVQLEIAGTRAGDLADQRERLVEKRLDLVLATEIQKPPIEVALTRESVFTNLTS